MDSQLERPRRDAASEHLDVVIVGAGLSGIGAAYHLQRDCPDKGFAMLEREESFGGTWKLHTYPGARSDSDLYTFGFSWKPWTGRPLASAEEILTYLDEALDEEDIRRHIRYRQELQAADWDSAAQCWNLACVDLENGEAYRLTCSFLWMCQGYYRHDAGYAPNFPDQDRFQGRLVHPQHWPDDLDTEGKRVVVIGSGATAATLIPAIAERAAHVTMLQRSPTFFAPRPSDSELAEQLRPLGLPDAWFHEIMRRSFLLERERVDKLSFEDPERLRSDLLAAAQAYLGEDYNLDPDFLPSYRPWQQRIALVPDGDLFQCIRSGRASVVTDHIARFTETGIDLKSGRHLEADVVVSATGLNLSVFGEIPFSLDGQPLDFSETWAYRGMLFSGVPNMAWVFGYLRHSWTLRAALVSDFVCRLLNHMKEKGAAEVRPELRPEDRAMPKRLLIEPENFNSGYIQRSIDRFPKQGDREPWIFSQNYALEKDEIPNADLDDGTLIYR
ncbi:MAG: NAD(P)/FAD-dependent oxidoreductase [Rhodospirillales bacterium]